MIYLPNIRWFEGEETKGPERDTFAAWLAGLADVYVNDAFSSWRAHGSTYDVAKHLPSYAGFQLQEELLNLHRILEPPRPFLGIIAGAKLDTKIGPLSALYRLADHVILGGLLYNVFLAAKYDVMFRGVSEEDKAKAMPLVELDAKEKKILEMPFIVESETMEGKSDGRYRTISVADFKPGHAFQYILDVDPKSYDEAGISETVKTSKSIFLNAVMGLTPQFSEGTRSLYQLIGENGGAHKMFAGGDTLQELRTLCPGQYMAGEAGADYYYFTGGGSVLTAIETGDPYGRKPIKALMD
jgi:phosphoglycerate kinase